MEFSIRNIMLILFTLLYGNSALSMEHEDIVPIKIGDKTFSVELAVLEKIPTMHTLVNIHKKDATNAIPADELFPNPSAADENKENFDITIKLLNPSFDCTGLRLKTTYTSFILCIKTLGVETNDKVDNYIQRLLQMEKLENEFQETLQKRNRERQAREQKFQEEKEKRLKEQEKLKKDLEWNILTQNVKERALERKYQQEQQELQRQQQENQKKIDRYNSMIRKLGEIQSFLEKPSLKKLVPIANKFSGLLGTVKQIVIKRSLITLGAITATITAGYLVYKKWF